MVLTTAAAAACAAPDDADAVDGDGAVSVLDGPLSSRGVDEPVDAPPAGSPLAEITQPELLAMLERDGFHFGSHLGDPTRHTNEGLAAVSPAYVRIADALARDLAARRDAEPGLSTSVVTGKNRVFDARWLRSAKATFELVGVLPRFDRRDVQPAGNCGEVRFLYRLAYAAGTTSKPTFSRMPFFFNVVYRAPADRCDEVAKRWLAPGGDAAGFVSWLKETPLRRDRLELEQIEVNAQVVRVPSENEKDMGGRAEYFLRVFSPGTWTEKPLENTPDVAKLKADPALRNELLGWIAGNVRAIDEGTAIMPTKFAATRAASFTTFGSVRRANKLFSSLFTPAELRAAGVDGAGAFAGTQVVASPEALLFRLDDMTCVGCHQGRSVAGFHFLGKERGARTNPLNALRTHGSPHYLAEVPRRIELLEGIARGETPARRRALSFEPPPGAFATIGTHCTLPEHADHFRAPIACEIGARCVAVSTGASDAITPGTCMPERGGFAGLPCLTGSMKDGATPTKDKLATKPMACQGGYACLAPEEGTPSGMCVAGCRGPLGSMNGAHEICAYGGGAQFDTCAMSGNFGGCLDGAVRPAPRQACDEANPCREDYMCQRLEPLGAKYATTPKTMGFCNPTYFIFQMRLDGHPVP